MNKKFYKDLKIIKSKLEKLLKKQKFDLAKIDYLKTRELSGGE